MNKFIKWVLPLSVVLAMSIGASSTFAQSAAVTFDTKVQAAHYSGTFVSGDKFHRTSGKVSNASNSRELRLSPFSTSKGPDVYVFIRKPGSKASTWVQLGKLQKFKGSQSYTVPKGKSLQTYSEVVIYCKKYKVVFGTAKLRTK